MKSDLSTLSEQNSIFKYADDTTLLVPEHTDTNINDEFEHIQVWATTNKLVINQDKTKKIVFRRPRPSYFHIPLFAFVCVFLLLFFSYLLFSATYGE